MTRRLETRTCRYMSLYWETLIVLGWHTISTDGITAVMGRMRIA